MEIKRKISLRNLIFFELVRGSSLRDGWAIFRRRRLAFRTTFEEICFFSLAEVILMLL